MEHLEIFDKGHVEWYNLIVTENSPLGPMLKHGAKKMHEQGVFDPIKVKWVGGGHRCRPVTDVTSSNMTLGLTHVSFVFIILIFSMILSLIVFLAELFNKYQHEKEIYAEMEPKWEPKSFQSLEKTGKRHAKIDVKI